MSFGRPPLLWSRTVIHHQHHNQPIGKGDGHHPLFQTTVFRPKPHYETKTWNPFPITSVARILWSHYCWPLCVDQVLPFYPQTVDLFLTLFLCGNRGIYTPCMGNFFNSSTCSHTALKLLRPWEYRERGLGKYSSNPSRLREQIVAFGGLRFLLVWGLTQPVSVLYQVQLCVCSNGDPATQGGGGCKRTRFRDKSLKHWKLILDEFSVFDYTSDDEKALAIYQLHRLFGPTWLDFEVPNLGTD